MRTVTILLILATIASAGCIDTVPLALGTTGKALERGRLSMKMESDYELASRALPASLKTVETFHAAAPGKDVFPIILAEGYCQYATAFVEDEWEDAKYVKKDLDLAEYHAQRATKMYIRCANYAFHLLGDGLEDKLLNSDLETAKKHLSKIGHGKRDSLMWAAIGIGGQINYNKDNIALVSQVPIVLAMMQRVIELDEKKTPKWGAYHLYPHMTLGMIYAAQPPALGGDHEKADFHFKKAMEISHNDKKEVRFLLTKVNFAKRLLVAQQKREEFNKILKEVLRTPGSIWPEERLANEVAHRRAKRYLALEKEWFND